jgi:GT2 family glycosyltransferase
VEKAKLSIVIGTYNRKAQIKRCIESIFKETQSQIKVYITDAGSNDGTIEYLQTIASERIIPVLVGERLGQARAYNNVFKIINTPYTCWMSDDNEVVNGGLDNAIYILEKNPTFGMVGLKVKDVQGPFINAPYIGGISSIGILNVNQGVLPTRLLQEIGGFSLEFQDYGIDPDLTARVLFHGYKIAYTKNVSLFHYRNWSMDKNSGEYELLNKKQKESLKLYEKKFANYQKRQADTTLIEHAIKKILKIKFFKKIRNNKSITRDLYNIFNGQYIQIFDLILNAGKSYYLVQALSHLRTPPLLSGIFAKSRLWKRP